MANRKKARFGGQNKKDGDVAKVEVRVDTPDKNKTEGIKDEQEVTSGAGGDVKTKEDGAEDKGENGTTKEQDGAEDKKKEMALETLVKIQGNESLKDTEVDIGVAVARGSRRDVEEDTKVVEIVGKVLTSDLNRLTENRNP